MKRYFIGTFLFFISITNAQSQFKSFINYVSSLSDSLDKAVAIDSFFVYARTKGIPFIENDTANFIYRGNINSNYISGDLNDWTFTTMTKLSKTNFFYYSQEFELNARIDYKFVLNGVNWILDPENTHQVLGGFGPNSELVMPDFVQPWEINYQANISHGMIDSIEIFSEIMDSIYEVIVYLPPDYDESNINYPTAYFQDGTDYINFGSAINILDNLLDSNKIQPLIGIFVRPNDRNEEYAFSKRNQYGEFFVNELVPFIDSAYRTISDPAKRLIIGDSFGGNITGLISYNHPEVFGNCGLQSAALEPNDYEAYSLFVNNTLKEIKIYSIWGSYEYRYSNLRDFRDNLLLKGYEFNGEEFPDGHSWGLWRAKLDDMLMYFFPSNYTNVIRDNKNIVGVFWLSQNYPNPFNPSTNFEFRIPDFGFVSLKVYDILGNEIASIINEKLPAGNYKVEWNAYGFASGVYFYKLKAGEFVEIKKLVLMK